MKAILATRRLHVLAVLSLLCVWLIPLEGEAAVGRTEQSYGVTQNGGVAYTIPIRVTDGVNGLTPNLSITYQGPGARTILGVGFDIAGISYITPCRKTIAQDINAAPVTLTSADRYCLDGARLRSVTGTYGATNSTYRTELDQLVRVTSLNSTSGIPGNFKVEMPNGLEYEYGNTADSKLLASGVSGAPPQFWAVNKITDTANNTMSFVYDTVNALRRFRPDYILYTAGNGGAARYKIDFVYAASTEPEPTIDYTPSNIGGAAISNDKLLERIDLSLDGVVYRQYLLTYQTGNGTNKRLNTVQECVPSAPDPCLPATQLTWQDASSGYAAPLTSNSVIGYVPLDINGDGIEDIAWASGTWRYMLGTASGFGAAVNTGVTATNPSKALPLEWNSDGCWDLLIDWSDGKWRVLKGSSTGFLTPQVAAGPSPVPSGTIADSWTFADVNSDGRDDLLKMTLNGPLGILVRINTVTGFGAEQTYYNQPLTHLVTRGFIATNGESSIQRPDFNGDGRTDLLVYACEWEPGEPGTPAHCGLTSWRVLVTNDTGMSEVGLLPYATYSIHPRYADFNGDGLTDVVYPAQTPGTWYIGYGQGSGNLNFVAGPSFANYNNFKVMTGDHDGDGYDDLYAATSSSQVWDVFRGSPEGFGLASSTGISSVGMWILADQTGDGLPDLGVNDSVAWTWKMHTHLGAPGDRLLTCTDGLGNKTTFSYLPMSSSTVYSKGTGATYPERDYQSAAALVYTMLVEPAGGISYTLTYKYKNAKLHSQGRSFLGMGTREINDSRSNSPFVSEIYRQDFPYIGAPAWTTVKQSPTGNLLVQEVVHTYANHFLDGTPGNQRYLPYRLKTVTKDYEVEVGGPKNGLQITEITEDHTVNTLGNSTFVSLKVEDKDATSAELGSIWKSEVTSTFSENLTDWCLALPLTRSEKRILPNGTNETRAASWDVLTADCHVIKETIAPGAGNLLSLVTDIGYDTCGNVNSLSSYPAGTTGQQRTTSINYGSRCQRPETITNGLNQSSTIVYDWALALPTTYTDPNGIVSGFVYDGFGRLTRSDLPDGTDVTYSLTACTAGNGWCGKNNSARIRATQSTRDTSNSVIRIDEQFLDGFGQVRWSHNDSMESGPSIVETLYDAFGQPAQRSQPYFTGGTVYSTSYAFDLIGRLTQINAPISESISSGRIIQFTYEGRDLKVTDPKGNVTTRNSNAIGQLRAVVDPSPGGTTYYAFAPFGELASITDAASNVTSWQYNERGFPKKTIDPDSGTWEYENNAFGEMENIRDAKTAAPNFATQFTFDPLGRPKTRKDVPENLTTTWIWGTSAANKDIGRLSSIMMDAGGYSEVFTYDPISRLSQRAITADGKTYNINLTYVPASGLLNTLEYPASTSSYRLKLGYEYANGLLKRVRDANGPTVFWEAADTDAFGHYQLENFGNGVQTFTDFDQASGLMQARAGGMGGGTGLIDSQVNWDLNGNLKQRKDLKLSPAVTEDIYYDNLNRFDKSERTAGGILTTNADVTLDPIGNITSKLGVGNYIYNATKKRAVVLAGGNSYGYDANGNMNSRNGSSIGYTSYNLPSVINAPGGYSSTLSYGAFRNRYKQVAVGASGTETTIYVAGLLEKVTRGGVTEYRHRIYGGQGTAAIYTRISGGSNSTYYVHADNLGSPELFTSSSGTALVRPSFAAYGERRDGTDWDGPPSPGDLTTIANISRRGFTGHEHLDAVNLIHMNGRVYEPVAGRFLSADPVVHVGFSQSPNPYAYVWNNPLSLVDPSGFDGECGEHPCRGGGGGVGGGTTDPKGNMECRPIRACKEPIEISRTWDGKSVGRLLVMFGIEGVSDHFRGRRTLETRSQVMSAAAHWLRSQGLIDFVPLYEDKWAFGSAQDDEIKLTCDDPNCSKFPQIDIEGLDKIMGATSPSGEVVIYRMAVEDTAGMVTIGSRGPPKEFSEIVLRDEFSIMERAILIIAHEGYHYRNIGLKPEAPNVEPWAYEAGWKAVIQYRLWWQRYCRYGPNGC